jgi:hypothetical protein
MLPFDPPLHIIHVEGSESWAGSGWWFAMAVEGVGVVCVGDIVDAYGGLFSDIFIVVVGVFVRSHPLILLNLYQRHTT